MHLDVAVSNRLIMNEEQFKFQFYVSQAIIRKQVTWFTQSQLTKMLALENFTTTSCGSAKYAFLFAESKRPPKLTKGRGLSAH